MKFNELFKNDENRSNGIFTIIYIVLIFVLSGLIWLVDEKFPREIPLFDVILISLATFRLVRLFTYDRVMLFFREYFSAHESSFVRVAGDLLNCPWCFGLWAGTFVVFFYFVMPMAWLVILILAISGVASFIQILINKIGWRAEQLKQEVLDRK